MKAGYQRGKPGLIIQVYLQTHSLLAAEAANQVRHSKLACAGVKLA